MNWRYKGKEIKSVEDLPEGAVGFVYKIDTPHHSYIGKKALYSNRNPEVSKAVYDKLKKEGQPVTKTKNKKLSKKGSVVWRYKKKVNSQSNWVKYNGSNEKLNLMVKEGVPIKKTILEVCMTKQQMSYYETKHQMIYSVLEDEHYLNDNILGKFFKGIV